MTDKSDTGKSALIIVDVQVGVMENTFEPKRVINNINIAVATARSNGIPIIWVQHDDEELLADSPSWQLVPALKTAVGDTRIQKQFNSSFEGTPLEEMLTAQGIKHIVLAGAATNWCIRSTAFAALERGYHLTLIGDAHTTVDQNIGNDQAIPAKTIIDEFNIGINYVTYPDRISATKNAQDIDFT